MSRSYNKKIYKPILCCGNSQKTWKQFYNRVYRRTSKPLLKSSVNLQGILIKDPDPGALKKHFYADIWDSPSDGRIEIKLLSIKEFTRIKEEETGYSWPHGHVVAISSTYREYLNNYKRLYISK